MPNNKAQVDQHWMQRALTLAQKGRFGAHPNPMVGCVLVKEGKRVGEGWHARFGAAHAEVHALRDAGSNARGATAYVTLEPCHHQGKTPPCDQALIQAGISRVVVAMQDPDPRVAGQGLQRLREAGIAVHHGVLEAEARALNPGFISRMQRQRPYVRVKMAMSLDGRTALANGHSQWITGPEARAEVQLCRAESDALLTGIGTVLADNPRMNRRLDEQTTAALSPQPFLRVVADGRLRTPADARLFDSPDPVLLAHAQGISCTALNWPDQVRHTPLPSAPDGLDLDKLLHHLTRQYSVGLLWVEAGPTLFGALHQRGLVDELYLYMAPRLLGPDARPLACLPPYADMPGNEVSIVEHRQVGADLLLRLRYPDASI